MRETFISELSKSALCGGSQQKAKALLRHVIVFERLARKKNKNFLNFNFLEHNKNFDTCLSGMTVDICNRGFASPIIHLSAEYFLAALFGNRDRGIRKILANTNMVEFGDHCVPGKIDVEPTIIRWLG